jgi:adenine phosphoribosyltransferase
MGIPLATALSERTDIPFAIVRKRSYGLPGEVAVHQTTGYSANQLYMNGVHRGNRVLFVDDVVSTGGTLGAIIQAVRGAGATLQDIVVVFEKGEGRAKVERDYNVKVKTLLRVDVRDGRVSLV